MILYFTDDIHHIIDLRQEIDVRQKPLSQPGSGATTPTNPQSLESRLQETTHNNNIKNVNKSLNEANGTVNHADQGGNVTPNKGMILIVLPFCLLFYNQVVLVDVAPCNA